MPGGWLHSPIWSPYGLYGTIDHTYGFKAYDARLGFTAAQAFINALETAAYLGYLYMVFVFGRRESGRQGTGAPDLEELEGWGEKVKTLGESRTLYGRVAALAVVVGYTTAVVTFSKTVLYCEWCLRFSGGLICRTNGICRVERGFRRVRGRRAQQLDDVVLDVDCTKVR